MKNFYDCGCSNNDGNEYSFGKNNYDYEENYYESNNQFSDCGCKQEYNNGGNCCGDNDYNNGCKKPHHKPCARVYTEQKHDCGCGCKDECESCKEENKECEMVCRCKIYIPPFPFRCRK